MSVKYCAHWSKFRSDLQGTSVRYRLVMLYWYWSLSEVTCDCSFETNTRRVLEYLRELHHAGLLVLPADFKFELHWDLKLEGAQK